MNQTVKIAKVVKAKMQGKAHKDIAREVFPNQSQTSASTSLSRMLKNANVQAALEAAMLRTGISLDKTLLPIAKALEAKDLRIERISTTEGVGKNQVTTVEEIKHYEDNIPLQLQGSDRARELLGIGSKQILGNEEASLSPEELNALAEAADEIELTRLLFKKNK